MYALCIFSCNSVKEEKKEGKINHVRREYHTAKFYQLYT